MGPEFAEYVAKRIAFGACVFAFFVIALYEAIRWCFNHISIALS